MESVSIMLSYSFIIHIIESANEKHLKVHNPRLWKFWVFVVYNLLTCSEIKVPILIYNVDANLFSKLDICSLWGIFC